MPDFSPKKVPLAMSSTAIILSKFIINPADYKQGKFLGKGNCGEVFLATDKDGREVAMKKLFPFLDPRDCKMFIREVVVPLRLNLPGVVKMIGFCLPERPPEDDARAAVSGAVIVTELMPNGSLTRIVDKEVIPGWGPTELSKCIFGIAATMAKVHDSGVIHRDLKPGNVFLDDKFEPRIADFGLSRVCANVSMTMAVGTPLFMAPELYGDSDDKYTTKVDVYAFAVLVYQMFTKAIELDDNLPTRSSQHLMMRIMRGSRLKKQKEVHDVYWDMIKDCWHADPVKRPTFSEIVDRLLDESKTIMVVPETDLERYHEYQERIMSSTAGANPLLTASRSGREVEALSVSLLASTKGGIFQKEAEKKSSGRAVRYDFTRSKYRR
jgi:serine/threonine protein kinase